MFSIDQHNPPRTPFEQLYIVARAINGPHDFDNPPAAAALQMFIDEGTLPVWISFGGNKRMVHPNQELAEAILNPVTTISPSLLAQVTTWRQRLGIE
jgi:hypothetical protein